MIRQIFQLVILLGCMLQSASTLAQDFQGKAYYFSKTTMDLSQWTRGRQISEQQKKQMMERMRPWLEKTYILTFNKEESIYKEDEKLEAPGSGRGISMWGNSFSAGPQYKNVKTKTFLQDQEFFGKKFLITEELEPLEWKMSSESKKIGNYTCFKATALKPSTDVNWLRRSRRNSEAEKKSDSTNTEKENKETVETEEEEVEMIEVVAWYTPQIPVNQGPGEYWGLPGLILEVSAGNVTMLCSKIVLNPEEKEDIDKPKKGDVVTKSEYNKIITERMEQMRANRGRGRRY